MSTHILFEHPLNEKMRTWLRIEFLFNSFHNICLLTIMPLRCISSAT
jgi:cell division FtsZ-interacting protein ZapD